MRMLLLLLMISTCLILSPPARAEFYKWVDENGTMQFSDTPPDNRRAEAQEFQPERTADTGTNIEKKEKKGKYKVSERTANALKAQHKQDREAASKKRKADTRASHLESCGKLKGKLVRLKRKLRKANNHPYSNNSGLSNKVWKTEKQFKSQCPDY